MKKTALALFLAIFGAVAINTGTIYGQSAKKYFATTGRVIKTGSLKEVDWSTIKSSNGWVIADIFTLCDTENGNLIYILLYKDNGSSITVVPNGCAAKSSR